MRLIFLLDTHCRSSRLPETLFCLIHRVTCGCHSFVWSFSKHSLSAFSLNAGDVPLLFPALRNPPCSWGERAVSKDLTKKLKFSALLLRHSNMDNRKLCGIRAEIETCARTRGSHPGHGQLRRPAGGTESLLTAGGWHQVKVHHRVSYRHAGVPMSAAVQRSKVVQQGWLWAHSAPRGPPTWLQFSPASASVPARGKSNGQGILGPDPLPAVLHHQNVRNHLCS